jgi:hypothetical protein
MTILPILDSGGVEPIQGKWIKGLAKVRHYLLKVNATDGKERLVIRRVQPSQEGPVDYLPGYCDELGRVL